MSKHEYDGVDVTPEEGKLFAVLTGWVGGALMIGLLLVVSILGGVQ